MSSQAVLENQVRSFSSSPYQHAIVIGSSIAGFVTARVLADHFTQVTVIERDTLPNGVDFRKGIPQSRHAHLLLLQGQRIMEQLFPGLRDELIQGGAVSVNMGRELAMQMVSGWLPTFDSNLEVTACSRPMLEAAIYRRLQTFSNVRFLEGTEVQRLCLDESGKQVIGASLRGQNGRSVQNMPANLIVDASGRDSKAPEWLTTLGFPAPQETTINAFPGYATRIYERPANFADTWKGIYIMPAAPNSKRGAVILPMEGNRWHVTLIGMAGDYPPTDETGFLEFARSLPSSRVYDALKDAKPLTAPYGYRRAENRLRHYDSLPRYLEGFLLLGDSVYALNPVYGQGMTLASIGAMTLDKCLREQKTHGSLLGLAQCFQQRLGKEIAGPWQMATNEDMRWPQTEGGHDLDAMTRLVQRYMNQVIYAMPHNEKVTDTFFRVQNMVAPPTVLLAPGMMYQVFKTNLANRFSKS